MKKALFVFSAIACMIFASCTSRMGDLTMLSTRNVDKKTDYSEIARNVKGKDTRLSSILFIPIQLSPNLEEALNDATGKIPSGEYMKNVTLKKRWNWYLLWSTTSFIVEGDVWGEASKITFKQNDVVNVKKKNTVLSGEIIKIEGNDAFIKYKKDGKEKIEAFKLADIYKKN